MLEQTDLSSSSQITQLRIKIRDMENIIQRCPQDSGESLHNFGNKLHHSHIFQSTAPFVSEIFEVRWSKPGHFLKLVG